MRIRIVIATDGEMTTIERTAPKGTSIIDIVSEALAQAGKATLPMGVTITNIAETEAFNAAEFDALNALEG